MKVFHEVIEFLSNQGISFIVFTLIGATLKSIVMTIHNYIFTKKILSSIKESTNIREIIQKEERSRIMYGADRVLVTQIHNGGKWLNGKSMIKLSMIYELSLLSKSGYYNFDSQLKDLLLTDLYPLIFNASSNKKIDILSINDLKESDFVLYQYCKMDSISYISVANIEHRNKILGYIFFIFTGDQIPIYSKDNIIELIELGNRIGQIMK